MRETEDKAPLEVSDAPSPKDESALAAYRAGTISRSNRLIHLLAFCAACLMVTAQVAEPGSGADPAPERPLPGDPLYFELMLFDSSGALLFSPRLIGEADRPALIELWGQGEQDGCDRPRLKVSLDALAARDGLDMALELTVGGLIEHHRLRLRMPMNEDQSLWIPTDDGGKLGMTLRAFRIGSPALDAYLEAVERRSIARAMPEA